MKTRIIAVVCIASMVVLGALALTRMPARVPMQYGLDGQPTWFGPGWLAAFFVPATGLLIWLMFAVLPKFDPLTRRDPQAFSYAPFIDTLHRWRNWLLIFLTLTQVLSLGMALGLDSNFALRGLFAGLGVLFMAIGNELGRLRPNSFAGIRMPWLMHNPEAWRVTHRFAGKVWFGAGALGTLGAIVLPPVAGGTLITALVIGAVALSIVYSYRVRRVGDARG